MIRRFGFLDTPHWGAALRGGKREAFMHGRRALILTVALTFVCSVWPVSAQRNNDNNKGRQQQPQRPPQEQQDVQALVTLVDTALMTDNGVPVPAPGAQAPAAPATPKPLAFGGGDKNE